MLPLFVVFYFDNNFKCSMLNCDAESIKCDPFFLNCMKLYRPLLAWNSDFRQAENFRKLVTVCLQMAAASRLPNKLKFFYNLIIKHDRRY